MTPATSSTVHQHTLSTAPPLFGVAADGRDLLHPLRETAVPIPPIFDTQLIPHQLFKKVQTAGYMYTLWLQQDITA